jgi:hypothetical protein
LGLSIVAAIADAHGGHVFLTETPGGGATFGAELPVEALAGTSYWGTTDVPDVPPSTNGAGHNATTPERAQNQGATPKEPLT